MFVVRHALLYATCSTRIPHVTRLFCRVCLFCICTCACLLVPICMDICMGICTYACVYECMCVCVHVCLSICMSVCLYVCTSVYLNKHQQMYASAPGFQPQCVFASTPKTVSLLAKGGSLSVPAIGVGCWSWGDDKGVWGFGDYDKTLTQSSIASAFNSSLQVRERERECGCWCGCLRMYVSVCARAHSEC